MAKIFDPSGETEFFEITELQKGFEKELKTGEKVTIAPGVREASFLREAVIRADLAHQYEDFKDRVLNPPEPPQPPSFRCICPKVIITEMAEWNTDFGFQYDPATPNLGCYLRFRSSTLSNLAGASNYNFDVKYPAITFDPGGEIYFNTPFQNNTNISTACQQTASTIGGWLTMEGFIGCEPGESLNWTGGPGSLFTNNVTINWRYGGNQSHATGIFNCNNIPDIPYGTEFKLWELTADLFLPAYISAPPNQTCYKNLTNFTFTNLYP